MVIVAGTEAPVGCEARPLAPDGRSVELFGMQEPHSGQKSFVVFLS